MTMSRSRGYSRRAILKSYLALLVTSPVGFWSTRTGAGQAEPGERRLRRIRKIENTWIPMKDGTRLAASIWLP